MPLSYCHLVIPIIMGLSFSSTTHQQAVLHHYAADTTRQPDMEQVFTLVADPPHFPGGDSALQNYLDKNLRIPKAAIAAKVAGTVYVQFVVDKKGNLLYPNVSGPYKGYGLEEEAVRVVSSMPRWEPGKEKGKALNVKFDLPVTFTLPEPKK